MKVERKRIRFEFGAPRSFFGSLPWPLLALIACLATASGASKKSNTIYTDDVDEWHVEVLAGAPNAGGMLQGPAMEAGLVSGGSMCVFPDGDHQKFFAGDGVIYRIENEGTFRRLAGQPGLYGTQDGSVSKALLGRQLSICPDGRGGLYIGDRSNRCLRRLHKKESGWVVETVAGAPTKEAWKSKPVDGQGAEAVFRYLHCNVIADKEGTAYIIDNNFLRRITKDGKVETLNPKGGTGKPGEQKEEPLDAARFSLIMGGKICFDAAGKIWVADRWNFAVRKVDLLKKTVSLEAGPGKGYRDGSARNCGFHGGTTHIAFDRYRNRIYVTGADDWGLRVLENDAVKTLYGGSRGSKALTGPARDASVHYTGVFFVDPAPPHEIYLYNGKFRGRIGRLFKPADRKQKEAK